MIVIIFFFLACLPNRWKEKKYPDTVPIPKGTPDNANTRSRTTGGKGMLRPEEFPVAWNPGSLGVEGTSETIPTPLAKIGKQRQQPLAAGCPAS